MAKTAIVTGATAGIGKEVARKLTAKGYRVVLACRNRLAALAVQRELLEEIPHGLIDVGPSLDLSSLDSIRRFVAVWDEKSVSLLVNNAGCNVPTDQYSEDGCPLMTQVNYLGPYLLTRLLVPALMKSPERPRVVHVASVMHRFARIPSFDQLFRDGAVGDYSNSKLALVMFSHAFQKRHGAWIDSCCVDPGGVRTKIFETTPFGYPPMSWAIRFCFAPPEDAAHTVLHAIEADATPQRSPFYARGIFASDWLTQFSGYRADFLGLCHLASVFVATAAMSMLDYPLRRWFSHPSFHTTHEVPPLTASLDERSCSALWSRTENFLNL